MKRGRNKKFKANEHPAAVLTIEQLVTELLARPDFKGAVTWEVPGQWQWRSEGCNAGLVFLQLASSILCQAAPAQAPPATEEAA
jgi:hypothetical protein